MLEEERIVEKIRLKEESKLVQPFISQESMVKEMNNSLQMTQIHNNSSSQNNNNNFHQNNYNNKNNNSQNNNEIMIQNQSNSMEDSLRGNQIFEQLLGECDRYIHENSFFT